MPEVMQRQAGGGEAGEQEGGQAGRPSPRGTVCVEMFNDGGAVGVGSKAEKG